MLAFAYSPHSRSWPRNCGQLTFAGVIDKIHGLNATDRLDGIEPFGLGELRRPAGPALAQGIGPQQDGQWPLPGCLMQKTDIGRSNVVERAAYDYRFVWAAHRC